MRRLSFADDPLIKPLMTPFSSHPSDTPIAPVTVQAVVDAMTAGGALENFLHVGWRLVLGGAAAAEPVAKIGEFPLHLERLEPALFHAELSQAIAALEAEGGQTADGAITQFVLAETVDPQAVATLLTQMLAAAQTSSEKTGLLRVSALGSAWLGLRPPETQRGQALQDFLSRDRLSHADQGIFASGADQPERFETLARFIDEGGQRLPAARILTGHESDQTLAQLDCLMLSKAAARLAADPGLKLSINVCRTTLRDSSWLGLLDALLSTHGSAFDRAVFEITEWPARAGHVPLSQSLKPLSDRGLGLWLDDFGAGLTSFNEVFIPGIDALKIDRSLLRRCYADSDGFGVLSLVTGFAQRQGKLCVVEGVEDLEERGFAQAQGASHVQGFFSGRI